MIYRTLGVLTEGHGGEQKGQAALEREGESREGLYGKGEAQ